MKTTALLAIALALLPPAFCPTTPALAQGNEPVAMIRTLQVLQEQIAHGNAAAQAAQPKLMAHIADEFLAADPAIWHDIRNAHAAVLFLLSGGKPSVIRAILTKTTLPSDVDVLLKGSLAYGEGQDEVARTLLQTVDPRRLPTTLGGHVALVEATLLTNQDAAKAEALFDLARLLVPGTLVEEAALRRQILLLADTGAYDKFVLLSRQYIRRYRASVYAENFRRRLASSATTLATKGDVEHLSKFDPVLAELPVSDRRIVYLDLARAAIVHGQTATARFAAEKAIGLLGAQGAEAARARLYLAAALIVSDDYDRGLALLQSADRALLPPEDVDLNAAALAVADLVRADPQANTAVAGLPSGAQQPAPVLLDQARKALADSQTLLQGPHP